MLRVAILLLVSLAATTVIALAERLRYGRSQSVLSTFLTFMMISGIIHASMTPMPPFMRWATLHIVGALLSAGALIGFAAIVQRRAKTSGGDLFRGLAAILACVAMSAFVWFGTSAVVYGLRALYHSAAGQNGSQGKTGQN